MMTKTNRLWLAAALAAVTLSLVSNSAYADGLIGRASALKAKTRAKLQKTIASYRSATPEAFAAVRDVKGHRPEVYRKRKNPVPNVSLELRRLGRAALLPMLEALAFQAPERGSLKDDEWRALKVGMLHAVGILRDKRSAAVLQLAFDKAQHARVQTAAALALGRLCDTQSYQLLEKSARGAGSKRTAAIRGLGQCRQLKSAKLLAELLYNGPADSVTIALGESLGFVGSSWAWRAMGPKAKDKGLAVREVAAAALVPAFIDYTGKARTAIKIGLTMVEYPGMATLVAEHRHRADEATAKALDKLVARIERRLRKR